MGQILKVGSHCEQAPNLCLDVQNNG